MQKRKKYITITGVLLIALLAVFGCQKETEGRMVKGMHLLYDKEKLNSLITDFRKKEGIVAIKVWINTGILKVGDDIMCVLVAGRLRTNVLPVFEELLSKIKKEVVSENEFL